MRTINALKLLFFWGPLVIFTVPVTAQEMAHGRFEGVVKAEWLRDREGRNMKLLAPLTYIDPRGVRWTAPTGSITDGASIPRALWTLYAPFTGLFRDAAVIHDHYCRDKSRRWKDVHFMFYEAMLANGVSELDAKTMWAGVYAFGPRWGRGAERGQLAMKNPSDLQQQAALRQLKQWISKDNPTLIDIEKQIVTGNTQ